jgi:WD40 repeat protein
LTGRPPFPGATEWEILRHVCEDEPARPRSLNGAVSRDLEIICLKCLSKQPLDRYRSAEALAEDLVNYAEGRPINGRRVPRAERVLKWVRRRPAVAGLTVAVVTLAAVGAAVVGWQSWQIYQNREELKRHLYISLILNAATEVERGQYDRADGSLDRCPPELRGWEWRFLKRSCQLECVPLRGHGAPVLCVQFSPDGSQVATASQDGTAKLWDPVTGRVRFTLTGHHGFVTSLAFTRGRLVTVDSNEVMRVWDPATGQHLGTERGAGDLVAASLHADLIAVRSRKHAVSVRNISSGEMVFSAPGQEGDVISAIALSPDGRYLAVGGYSKLLTVYDLQDLRKEGKRLDIPWRDDLYNVWSVAFSPDGLRMAVGTDLHGGETQLAEWDLTQGFGAPRPFAGGGDSGDFVVHSISYSPDGKRLAVSDRDGMVRVWTTGTHKSVLGPRKRSEMIWSVAFAPSGERRLAVTRGAEVTIEKIDPTPFPRCRSLLGHSRDDVEVEALAFDPRGRYLVTRAGGGEVLRWDLADGTACTLPRQNADLPLRGNLSFSPDGRFVISGSDGDSPQVWDVDAGAASDAIRVGVTNTRCSVFSHDGEKLALTDATNRIVLWDLTGGRELRSWKGSDEAIRSLAFFPGDKRLASCGADNDVRVWDTATGGQLLSLHGHGRTVTSLAISPDGTRIATASADRTVRIWDAASGEELFPQSRAGHSGQVNCVAFSHDGRRLASCTDDGTIKLWAVDCGQEVLTLPVQSAAVAFSPDGYLLAGCGRDGAVRIWDGRPLEETP